MILFLLVIFLCFASQSLEAQEFNATVTVNSDKIQDGNKNLFNSLQESLNRLINETKWTNAEFSRTEKIDCSFALSISEANGNSFKSELFIQSRRPVYNASYITTTVSFRDKSIEFEYSENQPLVLTQTGTIDNNLIAVVAFWCNLVLAADFDSFSPFGGGGCLRQAQQIAMQSQSSGWGGWSAFDDNKSRSSIINAYMDESLKPFRQLWYIYHRKSLDEMAANADRGRTTLIEALPVLKETRKVRDSEIVLQMFSDAKLEEIVQIAEKASSEERKNLYDLLHEVFPGTSAKIQPLTK